MVRDLCLLDESAFLSCSEDKMILLWNLETKSINSYIYDFIGKVYCLALTSDEKFLLYGTDTNALHVTDLISRNTVKLLGHSKAIWTISVSKDCKRVATGADDNSVIVWDLELRKQEMKFEEHFNTVTGVMLTENGKMLISCAMDKQLKIWNLDTRKLAYSLSNFVKEISCINIDHKKNIFYAGSLDTTLKIFSINDPKPLFSTPPLLGEIQSICLSPNENLLFISIFNEIAVFNTISKLIIYKLSGHARNPINNLITDLKGRVFSACSDSSIKIWNYSHQPKLKSLKFYSETTISLDITSDHQKLACGMKDGSIKIWNLSNKSLYFSVQGHSQFVWVVKVSSNNNYLASGSKDNLIKIWSMKDKVLLHTLAGHCDYVRDLLFLQNDSKIVSASYDRSIRIWDLDKWELEVELKEHTDKVFCLHGYNGGFFSGSADKRIVLWEDFKKRSEFSGHTGAVICIIIIKSVLISGSADKTIKIWDILTKAISATIQIHSQTVSCLLAMNDNTLISGSYDKSLKILDLCNLKVLKEFHSHNDSIYSIAKLNEDQVISCSWDRTLRIWDVSQQVESRIFQCQKGNFTCILISENFLFTGSTNGFINAINIIENVEEATIFAHSSDILGLEHAKSENMLISCSSDFSIKFWDLNTKKLIETKNDHTGEVRCLSLNPDQTFLASGSDDTSIIIWDLGGRSVRNTLRGHKGGVYSIKITEDSQFLVSSSADLTVKMWNAVSGLEVSSLNNAHTNIIKSIALIQDSNIIATCSADKSIRVWNFALKRKLCVFKDHTDEVECLIVSPTKKHLISGGGNLDMTVKIWNIKEKRLDYTINNLSSSVRGLSLSSNGDFLYICLFSEEIKIINLISNQEKICKKFMIKDSNIEFECTSSKTSLIYQSDKIIQKDSIANEYFPINCLEPHLNDNPKFYCILDSIQKNNFNSFKDLSSIRISNFNFGLAHILSYQGKEEELIQFLSSNNSIFADELGKSPFYYALISNHNKCAEVLLDFLIRTYRNLDSEELLVSNFAIRNDLIMIISNSIPNIGKYLKSSIIASKPSFISATAEIPKTIFNSFIFPESEDFFSSQNEGNKVQIFFKTFPLELPVQPGSQECISFFEAILNCEDRGILASFCIQEFINYHFNLILLCVQFFSILYFINLILMLCLLHYGSSWYLIGMFIFVNTFIVLWEIGQIVTSINIYFKDIMNYIDLTRIVVTVIWLIYIDSNYDYLEIIVVIVSLSSPCIPNSG